MNRRNFIKAASCGALLTGALPSVSHAAAENRPPIPGSLGMLYDSTLCVGCQACVTKCQDINFPERNLHTVPKYYPHLYGEKEGGGTQVLVLTGVPYENLDLPKLDDLSTGARSENIQHTLYKGMMLPLAVLAGLTVLVRRNTKNDHHDGGDDHES